MKNRYSIVIYNLLFVIFLLTINGFSQTKKESDNKLFLVKGGIGVPFGGYGLNTEFRYKKISVGFGVGYLNAYLFESFVNTIKIPESYNFGFDTRFYFSNPKRTFQPRAGIHLGWLNNYYNEKIGINSYDAVVYGTAFSVGVLIAGDLAYMGFDIMVDPGIAAFNQYKHPYYNSKVYITPSIGVGINLFEFKQIFKPIKIERPMQIKRYEISTIPNDSIEKCIINDGFSTITNDCQAQSIYNVHKGSCHDYCIYQQIGYDRYIMITIDLDKIEIAGNVAYYKIDSSNSKFININAIKTTRMNDNICDRMCNHMIYQTIDDSIINIKHYDVLEAKVYLHFDNYDIDFATKMNIGIKDVKLYCKQDMLIEELFFDRIIICDIPLEK